MKQAASRAVISACFMLDPCLAFIPILKMAEFVLHALIASNSVNVLSENVWPKI
jgi:hypothetical protein